MARDERERERRKEESRERKRASEHACTLTRSRARMVGTHARRRSAYSAAKTGVRKVANGEQRRESVGSPTWLTYGQSALHHRRISSWFPARYTPRLRSRARETDRRKRERKKKQESARASKERVTNSRKKKRERASVGRGEKEEERRVCIASRLPPTLGGKGVKEKDRKRGTTCRTREPLGHRVIV